MTDFFQFAEGHSATSFRACVAQASRAINRKSEPGPFNHNKHLITMDSALAARLKAQGKQDVWQ